MWSSARILGVFLLATPILGLAVKGNQPADAILERFQAEEVQRELQRKVGQVLVTALNQHVATRLSSGSRLDPIVVPDMTFNVTQPTFHVSVSLWNTTINGLSTLHFDHAQVNLSRLAGDVGVTLPSFVIKGQYKMKGRMGIVIPITGHGDYNISLTNATAAVMGDLKFLPDQAIFQLAALDYQLTLGALDIFFENLGGDAMNSLLSTTALVVLKKVEDKMHEPLINATLLVVNDFLSLLTLDVMKTAVIAVADEFIDIAFARIDAELTAQGFNHITLPDIVIRLPLSLARIGLHDGYIEGLATIHRTAPIELNIVDGKFKIGFTFGTNNSFFTYHMVTKVIGIGPDARLDGYVDPVDVSIVVNFDPENGNVHVDKFDIMVKPIAFDVHGLWILDSTVDLIITIVGNTITVFIEETIETFFKIIANMII